MKKNIEKINLEKINDTVNIGNKILKILYVLIVIGLLYIITLINKEWGILSFIFKVFKIISPFFIGFILAWLLNPHVTKLNEKGLPRVLGVILTYFLLILCFYLIGLALLPVLARQINDMVLSIPSILTDIRLYIDNFFLKLSDSSLLNLDAIKLELYTSIENIGKNLTTSLPSILMNFIEIVATGIGKILISFVIGFYLLFNFNSLNDRFIAFIPMKYKKDAQNIITSISELIHKFVSGTILVSFILFVVSLIGFSIIGLEAPVLFAVFCAITNLIPYIGPYIGAAPAVLVGLSQSPLTGLLTLIFIIITQGLESNFLQPVVIGKQMDLHPVTIVLSLLIFGYFFGIIGMVFATPIIAVLKTFYLFLDSKYNFFGYSKNKSVKKEISKVSKEL